MPSLRILEMQSHKINLGEHVKTLIALRAIPWKPTSINKYTGVWVGYVGCNLDNCFEFEDLILSLDYAASKVSIEQTILSHQLRPCMSGPLLGCIQGMPQSRL